MLAIQTSFPSAIPSPGPSLIPWVDESHIYPTPAEARMWDAANPWPANTPAATEAGQMPPTAFAAVMRIQLLGAQISSPEWMPTIRQASALYSLLSTAGPAQLHDLQRRVFKGPLPTFLCQENGWKMFRNKGEMVPQEMAYQVLMEAVDGNRGGSPETIWELLKVKFSNFNHRAVRSFVDNSKAYDTDDAKKARKRARDAAKRAEKREEAAREREAKAGKRKRQDEEEKDEEEELRRSIPMSRTASLESNGTQASQGSMSMSISSDNLVDTPGPMTPPIATSVPNIPDEVFTSMELDLFDLQMTLQVGIEEEVGFEVMRKAGIPREKFYRWLNSLCDDLAQVAADSASTM